MRVQEVWRREHLRALWRLLGARLGVAAQSPIVPLVVGGSAAAVAAAAQLLQEGFYVPAIRPPTVPPGSARCSQHDFLRYPLFVLFGAHACVLTWRESCCRWLAGSLAQPATAKSFVCWAANKLNALCHAWIG